ncbi:hypothetical protein RJT34_21991 [Clitoria ternatea]|uniref:Integral membrane bound transporter domain-containing protein n=1 Tax=Clitoria ternatea TaxID=43366 RepID=A0AAN9IWC9_CLITE
MIALCFVNGRHPTFALANAHAQGTAMGSVYGILCCFIFKSSEDFIFLPLLPWIFFCSFLSHSRMYGQVSGVSAVTGALLVIAMRHDGPASEFALARIVEVTIGLICFVVVEILFNPFRAASLAKSEVSESLRMIQDCIDQIAIVTTSEKEMPSSSYQSLREGQKKLKSLVCQLEDFTAEAELEPNFWFIPFHSACYSKMIEPLSRTVDLLLFVAYSMEKIKQLAQKDNAFWMDFQDRVNDNVGILKNKVAPTLKFLEEITRIESIGELEKELKSRNLPCDIESQEYPNAGAFKILGGDEEINGITDSFMQHLEGITNKS